MVTRHQALCYLLLVKSYHLVLPPPPGGRNEHIPCVEGTCARSHNSGMRAQDQFLDPEGSTEVLGRVKGSLMGQTSRLAPAIPTGLSSPSEGFTGMKGFHCLKKMFLNTVPHHIWFMPTSNHQSGALNRHILIIDCMQCSLRWQQHDENKPDIMTWP